MVMAFTMKAKEFLHSGQVEEALKVLQEEVRNDLGNVKLRALLFEILSLKGQWERAAAQLKVISDLDDGALLLARLYKLVLQAETKRREIFAGSAKPVIFGEPEPWMAKALHGVILAAEGKEALDAAPATPGIIDGVPCQWLADADLRNGSFLEAVIDGNFFWVPFFRIKQLRIQPPKNLRDLIWPSVGFQWSNGGEAAGFIFARYSGTEAMADGELLLGRKTEWREKAKGLSFGFGQRLLATEATDYPVLDLRLIDFTTK
jgi:type VI secretion system protein ImpE